MSGRFAAGDSGWLDLAGDFGRVPDASRFLQCMLTDRWHAVTGRLPGWDVKLCGLRWKTLPVGALLPLLSVVLEATVVLTNRMIVVVGAGWCRIYES